MVIVVVNLRLDDSQEVGIGCRYDLVCVSSG